MARQVHVAGTGSYVPERVLSNRDLERIVETSDEWIFTRTGIRERRMAAEGEATSHMGAAAARRAIENAGVEPGDLDMIIVATITADMVFPSTACFVQEQIGARNAFCFDLEAACAGYLFGIETARNYIAAGAIKTALVIGAEKLSGVTDWEDRATCVLFGDGAGAAVLQERAEGRGILSTVMGSDGSLGELLSIPGGGSRQPASEETLRQRLHYLKMNGREVFKNAVRSMSEAAEEALRRCGMKATDMACIVPHQANLRIIQAVADRLGVPVERFYVNLERYGNMSAASSAVALDEAWRSGAFQRGDPILMVVFGGGFAWGATVMEW